MRGKPEGAEPQILTFGGNYMPRPIEIQKIDRMCFVPGCERVASFIVTRNPEYRPTVIMCRECAKELFGVMYPEEYKKAFAPEKADEEKKPVKKPAAKKGGA